MKRYGVTNYAKTAEYKERYIKTCLKKYGVPNPLLLKTSQIYGKTQKELRDWLNSFGFNFKSNYSIIQGKEIDLYDSNVNLAIEYCGLFWHNELSPSPRLQSYHYDKYKKCQEKGIQLITIFEDEWKNRQNQCKSRLKSIFKIQQNPIYARKCKIIECSKEKFNEFCNLYHLQGGNNLGIVFYGLIYKNDLVACMSFGRHHRNKDVLTLDRLCFKAEQNVIGGSSKLFKSCVKWAKEKGYKEVVSWSDNRWSLGNIYEKLGFILDGELSPDYSYVNMKDCRLRLSKQSQKKSNTNCPKNKTESQWANENGLARIWDCGKKRWVYNLSKP